MMMEVMMKIELGATIPTVQYGNLQPKLELETTKSKCLLESINFASVKVGA